MKIFLTGSSGFFGQNLVQFYKDKHEVFEHKRYFDLSAKLAYFRPDVIINAAAEIYKPEDMWKPNVLWTQECLEYIKEKPTTKLIQIGSSSEYGILDRASKESDPINPTDMYSATKGIATTLCQGYAKQYGLDITVLRPYSVYGRFEKPHRLFPRLWRTVKYDNPMKLFPGMHDFIHIDDCVSIIDKLINTIGKGDIVNMGSGKQYSNLEVLELFEKIVGRKLPVEVVGSHTGNREVWICDTTHGKEKYGINLKYTLEAGIAEFLETAFYEKIN